MYTVDSLTHQKPDECDKITVQFSITQMQYLYSGKMQIQNPSAKCRDNRSSEQLRHERQLVKFVPFKTPGFPLIAGDLEGPEQLLVDLTP